jgi:peptide/nickel transport system substrate-binding protein
LELQSRPEYAEPKNGLPVTAVRQGLYSAIDRQELADVVTEGVAPIADSWIAPNDALRPALESSIPKFPYDLARAQQYLTEAGWSKGPDGVLVHPSGERFELMLFAAQISQAEKEQNVIAQGWKALGAQVNFYTIPSALAGDFEHRSKLPGAGLNGMPNEGFFSGAYLHSKNTSGPANRWAGANRMGYLNPRVDAILDRLIVTIPMDQRLELHKQLLQEGMGTVIMMPLYENVDPVIFVKAITGIPKDAPASTRTIFKWDRED